MATEQASEDQNTYTENAKEDDSQSPKIRNMMLEGCGTVPAKQRRNVGKYLIRYTVKAVNQNPSYYFEHLKEDYGVAQESFARIQEEFQKIREREGDRKPGKVSKDYTRLINEFMNNRITHIIFNRVLAEISKKFDDENFGRISARNREMYRKTIVTLYAYSCNVLSVEVPQRAK